MIKKNIDQQTLQDEHYMRLALELAQKGMRSASPNPMVGAVIVHPQLGIIGEGWHKKCGGPHAEVEAVASVASEHANCLNESTMYVTLEPCSHFGRTPPCCDLIIEKGFARVVVATVDCDSRVAGRGLSKIINAGIKVEQGLLEAEAVELNKRFFTRHTKARPYIILKWAQTQDGFLDAKRDKSVPPCWMTSAECKALVHKWRSEEDAIMVGDRTVMMDNSELTVRMNDGPNPIRFVMDPEVQLPVDSKIFNHQASTLLFVPDDRIADIEQKFAANTSTKVLGMNFNDQSKVLENLMTELVEQGVLSVFVEGGASLLNAFISQNLWDEVRVFTSSKFLKELYPDHQYSEGIKAPELSQFDSVAKVTKDEQLGLQIYRRTKY